MAKRFQYALELAAPPPEVYRVLTDTARWQSSRVYRSIRWIEGEPWVKDSVRELETEVPFRSRHRQRVLAVVPDHHLAVLSHGLGYTMQLEIGLAPSARGGTEVHYELEIYGALPLLFGFAIDDFVQRFMTVHIDELKRLCGETPSAATA